MDIIDLDTLVAILASLDMAEPGPGSAAAATNLHSSRELTTTPKSISPLYLENFLSLSNSDRIFSSLKSTIPFAQRRWGKGSYTLPRLIFSYDPVSATNAIDSVSIPILDELVFCIQSNFSREVLSVWCNLYRNGNDHCGAHKDSYNDPEGTPIDVFTFTFGSTRRFLLTPDDRTLPTQKFNLGHGDLFYFDSETNSKYKHSIPKTKKIVGERISIVLFVR